MHKKIKKIAIVVMAIALMLGTLALVTGCDENTYPRPNLDISTELDLTIRQSFAERHSISVDDVWIETYYGTYNGTSVVLIGSTEIAGGDKETTVTIAGIAFVFPTTTTFDAWFNDDFISVQQAYTNGLLTRPQLRVIHSIHTEK